MEDLFFEYIAQNSGYTYDQIVAMFGDFAMVYMDSGLKDFTINIREVLQ